jgi:hypothetical protein
MTANLTRSQSNREMSYSWWNNYSLLDSILIVYNRREISTSVPFRLTTWPYLEQSLLLHRMAKKRKRININDLVMSSTFPHWHMCVTVSSTRCIPAVRGNIIYQARWINNRSSTWVLIHTASASGQGFPWERQAQRHRPSSDWATARSHDMAETELWVKPPFIF